MKRHYNHEALVNNLVAAYKLATSADRLDGANWYPAARAIVADWAGHYGLPPQTVANVIAAISPQIEWERNLIVANDVLNYLPPSVGGALPVNVAKAKVLRDSPTLTVSDIFPTGLKVGSFAANLGGDNTLVTIDTHAAQVALNDPTFNDAWTFKPTGYTTFARAYADAAARLGIEAPAFQAILWVSWKRRYPRASKNAIRRANETR